MLLRRIPSLLLLGVLALLQGTAVRTTSAGAQQTFRASYAVGWNLVGGPEGAQFAGAQGALLTLSDGQPGYTAVEADVGIEAGRGYWAYFLSDTVVSVTAGVSTGPLTIPAAEGGWLLIGNPTSQPQRLSGADVAYQYDPAGGYSPLVLLPPGRGALIHASAGSTITLAPAPDLILAGAVPVPAVAAGMSLAPTTNAGSIDEGSIQVLMRGFGQSRQGGPITVAALLRNQGTPVDLVPVSITVYDAAGSVIAAGDTSLHYLNAGETTGLAHRLTPRAAGVPTRVDVQAGAGRAAGTPPPGTLTFSQETLVASRGGQEATAILSNSYTNDLSDVHVNAIVYDAAGSIIGGGATIKRLVPAGGSAGVAVAMDVSGSAARVAFYAQLP
jgi:hypothetical protein